MKPAVSVLESHLKHKPKDPLEAAYKVIMKKVLKMLVKNFRIKIKETAKNKKMKSVN